MISTRAKTGWTILRISLEERLVYRADFVVATMIRFLPVLTQILLWAAVFQTARSDHIAGFSYHDMVAYYLLTMISRALSSMPGLSTQLAEEIRDGQVKKYLVQPVEMIGFFLLTRVAHKIVYYLTALVPFAVVIYLCRSFFPGWPSVSVMLGYFAALFMAFLLGFFIELTLGMIAFWWLEVRSLLFIFMLLNFFFSGHMFPLDFLAELSEGLAFFVRLVPLQYLAYFPTVVFLGKVQGVALVIGLCIQFGWVLVFIALSRIAFHYGVKRYSGFGG